MKEETRRHLRRARRLLAMVETRVESELPEIIAHTAYYAMYHAVIAVFAEKGLPLPKTHSGIVSRLSQLDREESLDAKAEVARLSRALDRRLIADYEAEDLLTVEHVRTARDEAVSFISFCERLIGTP
ncbi:MAG: HEPN domain-containing protein [Alphaproteobacteria bacterium]|nr:HEPN domain-containing protein [Alphaproteobacteria bacterium]